MKGNKTNPYVFLCVLLCFVLAVISYVAIESLSARGDGGENNFQQVVHGVGLGATVKPGWCYINFDPRIDPRCPCIEWPIPGGYCYCPDHSGTVSSVAGGIETGVAVEIVRKVK